MSIIIPREIIKLTGASSWRAAAALYNSIASGYAHAQYLSLPFVLSASASARDMVAVEVVVETCNKGLYERFHSASREFFVGPHGRVGL